MTLTLLILLQLHTLHLNIRTGFEQHSHHHILDSLWLILKTKNCLTKNPDVTKCVLDKPRGMCTPV